MQQLKMTFPTYSREDLPFAERNLFRFGNVFKSFNCQDQSEESHMTTEQNAGGAMQGRLLSLLHNLIYEQTR